jgi:hypothetical protein
LFIFDGEGRFITAVLRPAKQPGGKDIKALPRRLLRAIRAHWRRTEILVRGDRHYFAPKVLDFCRANGLDFFLGGAPTSALRERKARRFKEFCDGAANWSPDERVIARIEAGA